MVDNKSLLNMSDDEILKYHGLFRWTDEEVRRLNELRRRSSDLMQKSPQFPEIVGERRLIRFIRSHWDDKFDLCVERYRGFLKWREQFNVNTIRNHIAYGSACDPSLFPFANLVNEHAPQIVADITVRDMLLNPIAYESYNFKPKEVFSAVTVDQYMLFLVYTLEYKSMIVEQVSEQIERSYIKKIANILRNNMNNASSSSTATINDVDQYLCKDTGFGICAKLVFFRDLTGVGLGHLMGDGKAMLSRSLEIAQSFYPETLSKSYMVNAPFVFTAVWNVVKLLIDADTAKKIAFMGSCYLNEICKEQYINIIPKKLGGQHESWNPAVRFCTRIGEPLWSHNASIPSEEEIEGIYKSEFSFIPLSDNEEKELMKNSSKAANFIPIYKGVGVVSKKLLCRPRKSQEYIADEWYEMAKDTQPQLKMYEDCTTSSNSSNSRERLPSFDFTNTVRSNTKAGSNISGATTPLTTTPTPTLTPTSLSPTTTSSSIVTATTPLSPVIAIANVTNSASKTSTISTTKRMETLGNGNKMVLPSTPPLSSSGISRSRHHDLGRGNQGDPGQLFGTHKDENSLDSTDMTVIMMVRHTIIKMIHLLLVLFGFCFTTNSTDQMIFDIKRKIPHLMALLLLMVLVIYLELQVLLITPLVISLVLFAL